MILGYPFHSLVTMPTALSGSYVDAYVQGRPTGFLYLLLLRFPFQHAVTEYKVMKLNLSVNLCTARQMWCLGLLLCSCLEKRLQEEMCLK